MNASGKRDFDKEAAQWDQDPRRVRLAADVAGAIAREAGPTRQMDALDYGCGTGLVTLLLQPLVNTITAADTSSGMLDVLKEKITAGNIKNVEPVFIDLEGGAGTGKPFIEGRKFHLIVSSMTMHHVPDTAALLRMWHELLLPGGLISVADLDTEDGSFHSDNAGVFHYGFDRAALMELMRQAGFSGLRDATASTMVREVEGKDRKFTVFLITGRK